MYQRQVGWKLSRNGKRVQHKFRFACALKEAQRRQVSLRVDLRSRAMTVVGERCAQRLRTVNRLDLGADPP